MASCPMLVGSPPGLRRAFNKRYLAVFKLLQRRDEELAEAFDEVRRSTAWRQLAIIRVRGLLTEDEFARFSPETQQVVALFSGG